MLDLSFLNHRRDAFAEEDTSIVADASSFKIAACANVSLSSSLLQTTYGYNSTHFSLMLGMVFSLSILLSATPIIKAIPIRVCKLSTVQLHLDSFTNTASSLLSIPERLPVLILVILILHLEALLPLGKVEKEGG
jgi:hypothetical protein